MKILIAYDGSSCADLALEDMRRAGLNDSGWVACPSLRRPARTARSRSCDSEGGPSEDSINA
jgi:hypothetical protein